MAGLFSPSAIEQVRAASDIVEIIGGYIPLKRAGANFVALCPFHKEKSPSFNVNPHRQIFHCFGCHKGGDVFTFVKEYENLTFSDAVRRLADRAHIQVETTLTPDQKEARHQKEILYLIHEQITGRWQTALNDAASQVARDYLSKRGVSEEAVKTFRIGYAPDAWDDTVNWARGKSFDLALVEQCGLIIKRENSEGYYDRFRGRLIFPICDEQGRVIGFSGRILTEEKVAKYVNSPETPIFTKGKVLYGLDKSKRAILDEQFVVICEGQLDLIACFMAGIKNIVAPLGTALTADHVRVLKRYVEEVVLCFDADTAGQNAAVRSLDPLLHAGMAVRVAQVPAPEDPDSYIKKHGGEAFASLIKSAPDFFDYFLDRLCKENDTQTDRGRLAVLRQMGINLQKTGNKVLLDSYAQKTALRLAVSTESVRQEFAKARPFQHAQPEEIPTEMAEPVERPPVAEMWLLRLVLENEKYIPWVKQHLDLSWLKSSSIRALVQELYAARETDEWAGVSAWAGALDEESWKQWTTEVLADPKPLPNPQKQLADTLWLMRNKAIDTEIEQLKRRLATHAEESGKLLSRHTELKAAKAQPVEPPA